MSNKETQFDYLIVGSGLFGATFAYLARQAGKRVLVLEKRKEIGGNIRTENKEGIDIHVYGAHIFHTSNKKIWDFVNSFVEFNRFTNSPLAYYKGKLYHLPFNMNTFHELFGVITPQQAHERINEEILKEHIQEENSAEARALNKVGRTVYETLIKGYTMKQWGRDPKDLPKEIIGRLPLRFTYDNNYFNDNYQGIPIGGYTKLIEKLLEGVEVRTATDFLKDKKGFSSLAEKVLYTGPIDAFFDYQLGTLNYRTLRFEVKRFETDNFQGNAVINYTEREIPYTRIIEHRHFMMGACTSPVTYVTYEYPSEWKGPKDEPYYPVLDRKNKELYASYKRLAMADPKVIFGGRLGLYQYFDMDDTIAACFELAKKEKLIS